MASHWASLKTRTSHSVSPTAQVGRGRAGAAYAGLGQRIGGLLAVGGHAPDSRGLAARLP